MFRSILVIALLLATASAFAPSLPALKTSAPSASSTARHIVMSEKEIEVIMQTAESCADGYCSVKDINELVDELKEQRDVMEERVKKVKAMVSKLEQLNEKEGRNKEEVKKFVKDMLRVFAHEKSGFAAVGFSGDIGDGPTTAYDALPPKPWKASK